MVSPSIVSTVTEALSSRVAERRTSIGYGADDPRLIDLEQRFHQAFTREIVALPASVLGASVMVRAVWDVTDELRWHWGQILSPIGALLTFAAIYLSLGSGTESSTVIAQRLIDLNPRSISRSSRGMAAG